ncbi:MAG: ion transporter, partial [Defluviitaleaceae bacterium]|nr:ion transporter [Defluviitaleaceae bacterium]
MMNKKMSVKQAVCNTIRDDGHVSVTNRIFNNAILALVLVNVAFVILELVDVLPENSKGIFAAVETFSVIVFTAEFFLRLWTADIVYSKIRPAKARLRYLSSSMSLADIAAVLPFYLELLLAAYLPNLMAFKALRLLRLLRLLKLNRYSERKISEAILSSIKEAIIVTDTDYNFLSANIAAKKIFPSLLGMKKYEPMSNAADFPPSLLNIRENNAEESFLFSNDCSEDENFFQAEISRVYNKEHLSRYIIVIHNITASVMLERAEKERVKNLFGRFVASEVV